MQSAQRMGHFGQCSGQAQSRVRAAESACAAQLRLGSRCPRPAAGGISRRQQSSSGSRCAGARGRQAGWHLPLRLRAWEGERTETLGLCQWCWCAQTHGTVSCPLRNGLVFGTGRMKEMVSTEYGPHQWPWLGQSAVTSPVRLDLFKL